jgi:hypothetical protein
MSIKNGILAATTCAALISSPALALDIGLGIGGVGVGVSAGIGGGGVSASADVSTSSGTSAQADVGIGTHTTDSLASADLNVGKSFSEFFKGNVNLLNSNVKANLGLGLGHGKAHVTRNDWTATQVKMAVANMDPASQARLLKRCEMVVENPGSYPALEVALCEMAI